MPMPMPMPALMVTVRSGVRWHRESILMTLHHQVMSMFLEHMLSKFIWVLYGKATLVSLQLRQERIGVCQVRGVVLGQSTLCDQLTGIVGDARSMLSKPMSRIMILHDVAGQSTLKGPRQRLVREAWGSIEVCEDGRHGQTATRQAIGEADGVHGPIS